MRNILYLAVAAAAFFSFTTRAHAAETKPTGAKVVESSLLADVDAATPGGSFTLGVRLKMKEHLHTYWINPGEFGNPTHITLHGSPGLEIGAVEWPMPTKIDAIGGMVYGYEHEVLFLIPVKVAKDFNAKTADIAAKVEWVGCEKEECLEGKDDVTISLPISGKRSPANAELFQLWKKRLPGRSEDAKEVANDIILSNGFDGLTSGFVVEWKKTAPGKIEFFPVSTNAVVIENIVIQTKDNVTNVRFKATIYKAENVPNGMVDSLLVYEDAAGQRHGIPIPLRVIKSK